jgi:ABC-type nitrate/sulfonate/bicarbonate transport system ATPase subunit
MSDGSSTQSQIGAMRSGTPRTRESSMSPCLHVREVAFSIALPTGDFPVLNEITFTVKLGEKIGILGPNGCGKSTLLRLLTGFERPTRGAVEYAQPMAKVGMIFQHVQQNLVAWKTVLQNIALPAIVGDSNVADAVDRAATTLEQMGLAELANRYPHELSGGQQQLVSLARWKANTPSILFVDEGWGMLDFVQRQRAYEIFQSIVQEKTCAVLLVSHNISELAGLADRVLVLTDRPAKIGNEVNLSTENSRAVRAEILWQAARKIFVT